MGGAAKGLADEFGFEFTNGFVFDTTRQGAITFSIDDGSLIKGPVTQGRNPKEVVSRLATFTGQGFQIPDDAYPLLVFGPSYVNFLPDTTRIFDVKTKNKH